jgi:hypothetical protein
MAQQNLPKIVVITDISDLSTPDMVSEAKGIKLTGDPDVTSPPVTETILHTEADDLLNIHTKRQTNPPTATAEQEQLQRDIVIRDYKKDALEVQSVANDVAAAAGDVAAGIIVVQRTAFRLKKDGMPHQRHFEVVESGEGWVHLRTKAIHHPAGYVWNYGITAAKDTPPTIFKPLLFTLEVDIIINNLQSGSIYAFQVAGILPVQRPTFSDGVEPLTFSDFIYTGIQ